MANIPDYDPLRKSWREAGSFNSAWLSNGEKLTWFQRIGFAVISLVTFMAGLYVITFAISSLVHGELSSWYDLLGLSAGLLAGVFIVIVGLIGVRNVLRF
jgi:hypothetical protein